MVGDLPMEVNEVVPEYKRYTYANFITWEGPERHELIDGRYYINRYSEKDTVPVQVLEGCIIDLRGVFAE